MGKVWQKGRLSRVYFNPCDWLELEPRYDRGRLAGGTIEGRPISARFIEVMRHLCKNTKIYFNLESCHFWVEKVGSECLTQPEIDQILVRIKKRIMELADDKQKNIDRRY